MWTPNLWARSQSCKSLLLPPPLPYCVCPGLCQETANNKQDRASRLPRTKGPLPIVTEKLHRWLHSKSLTWKKVSNAGPWLADPIRLPAGSYPKAQNELLISDFTLFPYHRLSTLPCPLDEKCVQTRATNGSILLFGVFATHRSGACEQEANEAWVQFL